MKVPPKRKGNFPSPGCAAGLLDSLNESPSEKEGKSRATWFHSAPGRTLNESPSEKEGKLSLFRPPARRLASPQ